MASSVGGGDDVTGVGAGRGVGGGGAGAVGTSRGAQHSAAHPDDASASRTVFGVGRDADGRIRFGSTGGSAGGGASVPGAVQDHVLVTSIRLAILVRDDIDAERQRAAEAARRAAALRGPDPLPIVLDPLRSLLVHVPRPLAPWDRPVGWVGSYGADARRARLLRFLGSRAERLAGSVGTGRFYLVQTKAGALA